MRLILLVLTFFVAAMGAPASHAQVGDKVLLVVSSHGRDQGRSQAGFEMDEYSQAWNIFRANGFVVDVASPAGGAAEPDEFDPSKPYNATTLADPEAMRWLGATLRTSEVAAEDYGAIYVLGGGGAMFDLYADEALRRLLAENYEAGGVVGGVCHGPAVLAEVRLSDGRRLVDGRRVTGFTNAEEDLFPGRWISAYPVLLETALVRSGAEFVQSHVMLPHVVSDDRIVTGQNPFSTALTVDAMIEAMGRRPVQRELYSDERSLLLVAEFLGGEQQVASDELARNPERYDAGLIGIYGGVLAEQAQDDPDRLAVAIALLNLASEHAVWSPRRELRIAQAEHTRAVSLARNRANEILARNPDFEPAKSFLALLGS